MTSYAADLKFLRQHVDAIELGASDGPRVAVVPAWQGRVATSTVGPSDGASFGWLNRELIGSGRSDPHMHAFGGEDRFWLGPEGGQHAIFFAPGVAFDYEHWKTPAAIDTEAYRVSSVDESAIEMRHEASLLNWLGTRFELAIERRIEILDPGRVDEVQSVAFRSTNTVTNTSDRDWTETGGLLSIWSIGMFQPTPGMTVVLPFWTGDEAELGPIVNDAYFGVVPADRLVVSDGVVFFRGDGAQRGKIGISPRRAKSMLGSYDAASGVLTIVDFAPPSADRPYVNSMWEHQAQPFAGDAVNSYNDGPAAPGAAPLGPFYELETSSPAAVLAPGESMVHWHRTAHFVGSKAVLDPIAERCLGVDLATIEAAF